MSTVVRARIDEKTKEDATAVLSAIGLTVSDAFRLMMVRSPLRDGYRSTPWRPTTRRSRP